MCENPGIKGPYHPFCMFEPNICNFYVILLTIISQRIKPYLSFPDILQNLNLSKSNIQAIHPP
ncbi:hypothetical protein LDENG_00004560 [Lucifuga dentata]|nr:hypothetical protein LDENG_00004560 [Lucifuga dentata]